MTINKTKLTISDFEAIEHELFTIKAKLDELFDVAWKAEALRLGRDLADASQTIQGLIYMTHPQPEWTGGDSSDSANFVKRFPHIAALD